MKSAIEPEVFQKLYADFAEQNPKWNEIAGVQPATSTSWDRDSTYIAGAAVLRRLLA